MIPQRKRRPRYRYRVSFNTANLVNELDNLIDSVGPETLIAAFIIRQAVEDLCDALAGKRFTIETHPFWRDPLGELHEFFASDWFARLAIAIGQNPDDLRQMIQATT